MGANSNLFLMMQEQEIQTNNFLPTKKEITLNAQKFAKDLIDSGNHNAQELFAQALRLKEVLSVIENELKNSLPNENFEAFGLKGTFRSGGNTTNYSEDYVIEELEVKIKERKALIDAALKSSEPIYDSNGVEVTKVSQTPRKSSLSITF